jgi:DNA-binding response OmpR family regulator
VVNRILVIEDESEIARLIELHLLDAGFEVTLAGDGLAGMKLALAESWNLIVLDLMIPGIDGLEICRRLRQRQDPTPILMLTAKSTELDRVLGLELGADDYLTKPFSVRELIARVKAILRRIENLQVRRDHSLPQRIRASDLTIEVDKRKVTRGSDTLHLTAKEFDLLLQFARNPGRVYSRKELLDLVWGYAHEGYEHTVNSHINRLRSKIEDSPAKPIFILTVWGVGYKFADLEGAEEEVPSV